MIKIVLVIVFSVFSTLVSAEKLFDGEDVREVFKGQDFDENLIKAEEGDARAQYLVGAAYLHGLESQKVEVDPKKGVFWLKKSGEHGFSEPYYDLAVSYREGLGVEKNVDKWKRYLKKAADLGLYDARMEIVDLYRYGDPQMGVEEDEEKYLYWLKKDAEAGSAFSMINLSLRYRQGRGLEKDIDAAFNWMIKAAEQNNGMAKAYAAEFYEKGLGTEKNLVEAYKLYDLSSNIGREAKQELAKKMTDDQIKEAIALSWQWQMERGVVHPSSEGYRYRYPIESSD